MSYTTPNWYGCMTSQLCRCLAGNSSPGGEINTIQTWQKILDRVICLGQLFARQPSRWRPSTAVSQTTAQDRITLLGFHAASVVYIYISRVAGHQDPMASVGTMPWWCEPAGGCGRPVPGCRCEQRATSCS